jgi:hypothetical protein
MLYGHDGFRITLKLLESLIYVKQLFQLIEEKKRAREEDFPKHRGVNVDLYTNAKTTAVTKKIELKEQI